MSSQDELEEPWARLVSTDCSEEDEEVIPLVGDKFSVGRGMIADLVISNNSFVSSLHCVLLKSGEGAASIKDTSTNGTLLNGTKLNKDEEVKLASGDVIKLVHRKDSPECNVSFRFEDLRIPLDVSDATVTYDFEDTTDGDEPSTVRTQEYCTEDGGEREGTLTVSVEERKEHSDDVILMDTVHNKPTKKAKKRKMEGTEDVPTAKRKDSSEVKTDSVAQSQTSSVPASSSKPAMVKKDSIEETLICQICQEILHDCVSLQPCMHSYCAGCYSDWMVHSKTCPACRLKVERISKNHIVNNLVDAYFRANPDKKRSDEDLKELDDKNKITKDMLYPKRKHRHDYDDDEYDYSDEDSSSTDDEGLPPTTIFPLPFSLPFGFSPFAVHPPTIPAPPRLCRQCTSYAGDMSSPPSHPTPPPFTCTTSTNHVLCLCCLQPMPDRRHDTDMSIPPQKCDICGQAYCHMYWGCRKFGCRGCLNLFKDMDFDSSCLGTILNNGNTYESRVLKDYLETSSLTVKDMLDYCYQKLDDGEYLCTDSRTARMSSSTRTCYKCAMKNFRDLAYLYRKDIPSDDLPDAVTRRPDCYWGKNCRTQVNKPLHAEKFNHICDQTRF